MTLEEFARHLGGYTVKAGQIYCYCPAHPDEGSKKPNLHVSYGDKQAIVFACMSRGCPPEARVAAVKRAFGIPADQPISRIWEGSAVTVEKPKTKTKETIWIPIVPVPDDAPAPVPGKLGPKYWTYRNAEGKLLGYVKRVDKGGGDKDFYPILYCCNTKTGARSWESVGFPNPHPLYGIDRLAQWCKTHPAERPKVLLVEGEKKVDAATRCVKTHIGISAMGGNNSAHKSDWTPLAGCDVTIWRDNDKAGQVYADVARTEIAKVDSSVTFTDLPVEAFPPKYDIVNAEEGGQPGSPFENHPAWQPEEIQAFVNGGPPPARYRATSSAPVAEDLNNQQFEFLGVDDDTNMFIRKSDNVLLMSAASLGSKMLFLAPDVNWWWRRFPNKNDGVDWTSATAWFIRQAQAKGRHYPFAAYLKVEAEAREHIGERRFWAKLLSWQKREQRIEWLMPMESLSEPAKLAAHLRKLGLDVPPGREWDHELTKYLQSQRPDKLLRFIKQMGWYGDNYALPNITFGPTPTEALYFQAADDFVHAFNVRGSLADWKREIGPLCIGNSRLLFALALAFVPPLLALLADEGEPSFGVNLRGGSTIGKTTIMDVAGSIWGGGRGKTGYRRSWKATVNGIEGMAALHNDALLCLDEMSLVTDVRLVTDTAYMLSNGEGKDTMTTNRELRSPATWRLVWLSDGELSLEEMLRDKAESERGGQFVRLVDLPSVVARFGDHDSAFEELHKYNGGGQFADALKALARQHFGSPIRRYLDQLTRFQSHCIAYIKDRRRDFRATLPAVDVQAGRVADRFALIAAAGALACHVGALPFSPREIGIAVRKSFKAWLRTRGTQKSSEWVTAIQRLRLFVEQFGRSRFDADDLAEETSRNVARVRAGYHRKHDLLFLPEVWKTEICAGTDRAWFTSELMEQGIVEKPQPSRAAKQPTGSRMELIGPPDARRQASVYVLHLKKLEELDLHDESQMPLPPLLNERWPIQITDWLLAEEFDESPTEEAEIDRLAAADAAPSAAAPQNNEEDEFDYFPPVTPKKE